MPGGVELGLSLGQSPFGLGFLLGEVGECLLESRVSLLQGRVGLLDGRLQFLFLVLESLHLRAEVVRPTFAVAQLLVELANFVCVHPPPTRHIQPLTVPEDVRNKQLAA